MTPWAKGEGGGAQKGTATLWNKTTSKSLSFSAFGRTELSSIREGCKETSWGRKGKRWLRKGGVGYPQMEREGVDTKEPKGPLEGGGRDQRRIRRGTAPFLKTGTRTKSHQQTRRENGKDQKTKATH